MNEITATHHMAMALIDQATIANSLGNKEEAKALTHKAFLAEKKAALAIAIDYAAEPTRSILLRSAATLAIEVSEQREAEKLIALGLAGDPPRELAEELRDLLERVNFDRHLDLRGIRLQEDEVQLSIAGQSVSHGMALTDEFLGRVEAFEKLIVRTAERKLNHPYREHAAARANLRQELEVYISVPRPASFAVSMKVGHPAQKPLQFDNFVEEVIDDVLENLRIFDRDGPIELKSKIKKDAYYRNFIGLAGRLAPNGEDVKVVGFTRCRAGVEKRTALTKTRSEISGAARKTSSKLKTNNLTTVSGRLSFADSTTKRVGLLKLIDENGNTYRVKVPLGMMNDIVRPLWDDYVSVKGKLKKNQIDLVDIWKQSKK